MMDPLLSAAIEFLETDLQASKDDWRRLGPEAPDYWADIARGQEMWSDLATEKGRAALRAATEYLFE